MLQYDSDLQEVENEEDSSLSSPNVLDGVVVTDTDWTAETVLSQINKGNILLNPKFQRREAWDLPRKSRFIESLMVGLPIPQLVLAEMPGQRGRFIVIDGKQRLLALAKFAASGFTPDHYELRQLELRSDLNGKTWDDLSTNPKFSEDVAAFENAQIRTTIIRGWKHENALYLIFHRLNSGSVPLSPQELRHVLHPGPFIDFAFEFSEHSKVLIDLMGTKGKPDFRMRDVELLIRFIGLRHFLDRYEGDLKKFLDGTVKNLNDTWGIEGKQVKQDAEDCEASIEFTKEIFGDNDAFSKWSANGPERRFNRAVFDIMTFYFANRSTRDVIRKAQAESKVREAYIELCRTSPPFLRAIESTTKSTENVATRLTLWGRALKEILGTEPEELPVVERYAAHYGVK
jgi:hypothetical protein